MKKIISLFLISVMIICLVACTCEHEWDNGVIITEATCENVGVREFTCKKCGEKKTEDIVKKDHDYAFVEDTATCSASGNKIYKCKNCQTEKVEYSSAKGHNYVSYFCENCKKVDPSLYSFEFNKTVFDYTYSTSQLQLSFSLTVSEGSKNVELYAIPYALYTQYSLWVITVVDDTTKEIVLTAMDYSKFPNSMFSSSIKKNVTMEKPYNSSHKYYVKISL